MNFLKTPLLISLMNIFIITACSSKHDMKVTEVFRSNILDDGAKMFTFSIIFINRSQLSEANNKDADKKQGQGQQGKGRGSKGGKNGKPNKQSSNNSGSLAKQMTEELETRLLDKLEDTNYCRKGYFELDRTINRSIYTIHGECSESATPADIKTFGK